ncbi:hypothetical protein [Pelomonas sp. KK5]|uniref:hypothetical protein n=1 Tax=Pelomonas sp. KK5 TaxID=1855730 RepID=UPI00097BC1AC|nr:hypothetical protein [Pelomonas sp. KK5]
MADKLLTDGAWKAFAKKKDYKDAALLKAFARLDAAEGEKRLQALDELESQSELLLKANKADKELAAYLGDLRKALDKERRAAEDEAKKAAAAAKASAASDDDESGPAVLTTKMVPILREVAKGGEAFARIAVAGKVLGVLVSRKPLTGGSKAVMAEYLGVGGLKYFDASCIFEAGMHTFVMEARPSGVAKLLKKALLDQTGLRWKVRVRGQDPADVEDAGDEEEEGRQAEGEEVSATGTTPGTTPDPDAARYTQLLAELDPRLQAALKQPGADASKLRAVSDFAQGKAEASQYGAAIQALQRLAGMIDALAAAPSPMDEIKRRLEAAIAGLRGAPGLPGLDGLRQSLAEAGAAARDRLFDAALELIGKVETALANAPQGGPARGSVVALQQARLSWDGLRKALQGQLQGLEKQLLADVRAHNADPDAPDLLDEAEVTTAVREVYTVLDLLDTRLIDKLDEALNAEGAARQAHQAEAAALVQEYQRLVASDPRIADIDDNGFFPTSIRAEAQRTLNALLQQL